MNIPRRILFLSIISIFILSFASCDEEEDDFTSGSFYPNLPDKPDEEEEESDTTITSPTNCWKDPVMVSRAVDFIDLFTRYGDGWTGGDATYSILLPDGRTVWLFGDTFLGTVNADRSRPGTGLLRNTFVVQDGEELTTLTSGNTSNPGTFVNPPEQDWWYWPGDGMVINDTLQVIMFGFGSSGTGGQWDFEYKSVDLAKFSLPEIELISIDRLISSPTTNFGASILESDDGYLYLYGAEKVGFVKYLHVARTAADDLSNTWTYYTGEEWSEDASLSKRLFSSVSEQFTVFQNQGNFYLMTQHHILGGEIYMFKGTSEVGPFSDQKTLYCTPESGGDIFTYNAFTHLQFSTEEEILISYNINSFNYGDLFKNADNYRPYFIRVKGWQ